MGILEFAERELDIIVKEAENKSVSEYKKEHPVLGPGEIEELKKIDVAMTKKAKENVIELMTVLHNQGHTGFSVQWILSLFNRLVDYKPLTELTGADEEWKDVSSYYGNKKNVQQNKRCPSIFRENNDNSTAHNVEGKIFTNDGGKSWWSSNDSNVPVTFPYANFDFPEKVYLNPKEEL